MISTGRVRRISLELTRRCNSACIHCFAGADQDRVDEMPRTAARRVIQEGAVSGYRQLHLTGGEPLLYEGIIQVIDLALEAGYESILLNTNGLLLDRPMCRQLARRPELTLSVSLETGAALHDRIRGEGTYRQVLEAVETALSEGLHLILFSIVCRSNLAALPKFVNAVFSRFPAIQYMAFNRLLRTGGDPTALRDEYLSPEDFPGLVRLASLLNGTGHRIVLLNEPLANVVSRRLAIPWVPESMGLDGPGNLMVRADLSLVPSRTNQTFCGVYTPGAIEKMCSNERYRKAVAPDTAICPACRHAGACRAGGLQHPVGLGIDGPPDASFCKAVLELLVGRDGQDQRGDGTFWT